MKFDKRLKGGNQTSNSIRWLPSLMNYLLVNYTNSAIPYLEKPRQAVIYEKFLNFPLRKRGKQMIYQLIYHHEKQTQQKYKHC